MRKNNNDKVRKAIMTIVEEGGTEFMTLNDLTTLIENKTEKYTGRLGLGKHQVSNFLHDREAFKVTQKRIWHQYQYSYLIKIEGREAYLKEA